MTSASMTAFHGSCRIPRRRYRSFRTPAQRAFAGTADRYRRDARHHRDRLGRGRRGADRGVHHHRRDRSRCPYRAGLSRSGGCSAWSRHPANPSSRDPWRQPRAALALLVFSQSADRLPQEGRNGLSGPIRQSSLRRRLRSRPLRGAASLDHGGSAAGL